MNKEELIHHLKYSIALPLDLKIEYTKKRIKQFYDQLDSQVYISFSGGKDSTVLLHIARTMYPKIRAVFLNTGLEYPEVIEYINTWDNIEIIRPKKTFKAVIDEYGFPVVSKEVANKVRLYRKTKQQKLKDKILNGDEKGNGKLSKCWHFLIDAPFGISDQCCYHLKKGPAKAFEHKTGLSPIIGTMVEDSRLREHAYYQRGGCNSFNNIRNMSTPLSFWTEKDIWEYIHIYIHTYSKIYDMGYKNTGCAFCMFGLNMQEKPNKFDLMKTTHPKLYDYCMNKLGMKDIINYIECKGKPSLF